MHHQQDITPELYKEAEQLLQEMCDVENGWAK